MAWGPAPRCSRCTPLRYMFWIALGSVCVIYRSARKPSFTACVFVRHLGKFLSYGALTTHTRVAH
jgi:hypothetical protein